MAIKSLQGEYCSSCLPNLLARLTDAPIDRQADLPVQQEAARRLSKGGLMISPRCQKHLRRHAKKKKRMEAAPTAAVPTANTHETVSAPTKNERFSSSIGGGCDRASQCSDQCLEKSSGPGKGRRATWFLLGHPN